MGEECEKKIMLKSSARVRDSNLCHLHIFSSYHSHCLSVYVHLLRMRQKKAEHLLEDKRRSVRSDLKNSKCESRGLLTLALCSQTNHHPAILLYEGATTLSADLYLFSAPNETQLPLLSRPILQRDQYASRKSLLLNFSFISNGKTC